MRPYRWQPTRFPHPWDSPGKNTGVGCHFLLQCMKVKSEIEVAQSCPTPSDPVDCSLPGSSVYGIFQARVLEWGAIAFSLSLSLSLYIYIYIYTHYINVCICVCICRENTIKQIQVNIENMGILEKSNSFHCFCKFPEVWKHFKNVNLQNIFFPILFWGFWSCSNLINYLL